MPGWAPGPDSVFTVLERRMLNSDPPDHGRLRRLVTAMVSYFRALLAARRREPTYDLLSALIAARDQADSLSEDELVSMAFLLLVAGHETTVNLIASGVLALLLNPRELARLRADASLIGGAVEELLRYVAPVSHTTFRCAAEPVDLGGVRIGRGDPVFVALSGANRDAARFGDPEGLDLGRDRSGHLAFGHGIHYCVGAAGAARGGDRLHRPAGPVPPPGTGRAAGVAALAAEHAHPRPGVPAGAAGARPGRHQRPVRLVVYR